MKKFLALFFFLGLFFVACESDDAVVEEEVIIEEPIVYTNGSADFTNYVAIGNSLTAGYSDNALFIDGQLASYPVMLASNFSLVGGGDFNVPLMADNLGGLTFGGNSISGNRLILSFATGSPLPVPVEGTGTTEVTNTLSGSFNNMGVPGATSYTLLAPGYGNVQGVPLGLANPYYARFASSAEATILGDAAAQNPTFFSLWIGNNDVLGYATSGGTGVDQAGNLDPSTYARNDISDPNVVAGAINATLQTMTANGAKGVIANIPEVTSIPYFTTVPYNAIPLDAATADLVNGAYAQYNGGLAQLQQLGFITAEELEKRTITFSAGPANAVVMLDEDLTDLTGVNPALINMRQATPDDLLVLTSSSFLGTLANPNDPTSINGVAVPLADKWVLTPEEQLLANNAIVAFNSAIEALATQYDLAFVDANALQTQLNISGFTLADGSVVTGDFGTGGGFSLDGVHPSPRGSAILANAFIAAINAKYGSDLPGVNPLDFTGLYIK
ncbi:MAG: G-D-S-L family lipolytic protein [Croceitalea sp.]|nr:G-D-S-L family lipolytic protein [Croceitalea sp.]MBT8238577.1 G-D-S-L family lipolytic protein [Croceitalea sp.]NNC34054.1 G-D-S-L family lipolytic protein [Croceitalea sp.]NNL09417.1 G-D-S-L family lipolytic protein [Croceitalea sp.]